MAWTGGGLTRRGAVGQARDERGMRRRAWKANKRHRTQSTDCEIGTTNFTELLDLDSLPHPRSRNKFSTLAASQDRTVGRQKRRSWSALNRVPRCLIANTTAALFIPTCNSSKPHYTSIPPVDPTPIQECQTTYLHYLPIQAKSFPPPSTISTHSHQHRPLSPRVSEKRTTSSTAPTKMETPGQAVATASKPCLEPRRTRSLISFISSPQSSCPSLV
jgi:hypothetical protein